MVLQRNIGQETEPESEDVRNAAGYQLTEKLKAASAEAKVRYLSQWEQDFLKTLTTRAQVGRTYFRLSANEIGHLRDIKKKLISKGAL